MSDYPSLNEIAPSWADIKITLPIYDGATIETADIAAVKWSEKVEVGTQRGTSGIILRRTTGQNTPEGSITFYRSGWRKFLRGLKAQNERIALVGFDVLIQHTPPGETDIYKVALLGCRVMGRGIDHAEGTDAEKVEIPLSLIRIEEDGTTLL